jgi:hypothetical protein
MGEVDKSPSQDGVTRTAFPIANDSVNGVNGIVL